MSTAIDTARVTNRRALKFHTIEEVLADIDRIVAAEQAGTLRHLGNWLPGQILGHVAAWIDYGYEGYPVQRPPWFIRLILRFKLKRYMQDGLPSGVRIPGTQHGTFGIEPLSTAEGAERLRRALRRLQDREPPKFDSPAFGPMSHDDRVQLNLRHAELHLSFLQYENGK